VGQTGRLLKARIGEHRNHINRNMVQHSVISEYRIEFSHEFNWGETLILDQESRINYNKRLISEMLHIHKQKQGLNLQTDMDNLDLLYLNLFVKM